MLPFLTSDSSFVSDLMYEFFFYFSSGLWKKNVEDLKQRSQCLHSGATNNSQLKHKTKWANSKTRRRNSEKIKNLASLLEIIPMPVTQTFSSLLTVFATNMLSNEEPLLHTGARSYTMLPFELIHRAICKRSQCTETHTAIREQTK